MVLKEKEKNIEDVLGRKDLKNFEEYVDNLKWTIENNMTVQDVLLWGTSVCSFIKKLKEVVE
jgi:hypothetical protein